MGMPERAGVDAECGVVTAFALLNLASRNGIHSHVMLCG